MVQLVHAVCVCLQKQVGRSRSETERLSELQHQHALHRLQTASPSRTSPPSPSHKPTTAATPPPALGDDTSLYQHLQRLHLQHAAAAAAAAASPGSPDTRRCSPPSLMSPVSPASVAEGGGASSSSSSQNLLHMIKEDSADMADPPPSACGDVGPAKHKKYHNNPQISITDDQGQPISMKEVDEEIDDQSSTDDDDDDDEEMEDEETNNEMLQQQQILHQQQLLQQQQQQHEQQLLFQQHQQQMWQEMFLQQYNAAAMSGGQPHKQYSDGSGSGLPYTVSELVNHMALVGGDGSLEPAGPVSTTAPTIPTGSSSSSSSSPAGNGLHDFCIGLKRTMSDILSEIKNVLDRKQLIYQQAEDNRLLLENTHMQMELQLLPAHGITENRLKFRRISGDSGSYKQLCHELLTGINL